MRLDVLAPAEVEWRPGQHFFLRVPRLEGLGNHPFTIASAFKGSRGATEKGYRESAQPVSFYIRSHAGFTKKLAAYGHNHPKASPSAWLEGPYGGIPYAVENTFDRIILVAGGGGVTACLPWLEHLAMKRAARLEMRTMAVRFIWAVRRVEHLGWAGESVSGAENAVGDDSGFWKTLFYVTGDTNSSARCQEDVEVGRVGAVSQSGVSGPKAYDGVSERDVAKAGSSYRIGRPRMVDVVPTLVAEAGRTLVIGKTALLGVVYYKACVLTGRIGCGPESLKTDLSNVCAQLQIRVLRGEVESVALHNETFGW